MPRITTTFGDQARAKQERYNQAREVIEKNTDLSADGKQRQLNELRDAHRKEQLDLQSQERTALQGRRTELVGRLFGVNRSDPAAVIGHRDATDRAAQIKTQAEAQSLIERASANGDEQLAAAVAQRAADLDWGNAFDAWRAPRPHVHDVVEELADIDHLLQPKTNFVRGMLDFGGGTGA